MSNHLAIAETASVSHHDQDQDSAQYLHLRQNVYYFKRAFPARIARQLQLSKRQVWKSLGTRDECVASVRCNAENSAFEKAMNDAKIHIGAKGGGCLTKAPRGDGTTKYLLAEHIPFLLERYAYAQHRTADEERANASRQEIEEQRRFLTEFLEARRWESQIMDYDAVEDTATELLSAERLIAPPGAQVRTLLLPALLAADIQVLQEQLRRLNGEPCSPTATEPMAPRAMPTMLNAFNDWRERRAPGMNFDGAEVDRRDPGTGPGLASVTRRTVESYKKFVDEFESVCGALPVMAITLKIACKHRDHLIARGLLRETVKNHFGALAAMLRTATFGEEQVKNKTNKNVFDFVDLEMVPERPDSELRRAYEVSELCELFQSPVYTQGMRTEGQAKESSYWAPILGPFVGARIEEIAQLRVEDVQRIKGVLPAA